MADRLGRRKFLTLSAAAFAATGATAVFSQCAHNSDDLDFKIGQMLFTHFSGLTVTPEIAALISEEHLGGVLLLESNFSAATSPKDSLHKLIKDLQNLSHTPLFIAMDQEGGAVNRLKEKYGFPSTYSAHYLGQRNDLQLTKQAAERIAGSLSELGINHNFAPVVDLNINPANPVVGRNNRCFSADPDVVAEHAAVFIRAHRERHIMTTLKHFPGHGSSTNDSHAGLADVTNTWREVELRPYHLLIKAGLVDSIMTAHIFNSSLDDVFPASLSVKMIGGLLRDKLGFDGVVISDDLLMGAIKNHYSLSDSVSQAINAGNDILMFTTTAGNLIPRVKSMIKEHVASGAISAKRIDESFARIKKLKNRL